MGSTEQMIHRLRARLGARSRGWTASVAVHALLMAWLMCSAPEALLSVAPGQPVFVDLSLAEAVAGPDGEPGAQGGGSPVQAPSDVLDVPVPATPKPRAARARPAAVTVSVSHAVEGLPVRAAETERPADAEPAADLDPLTGEAHEREGAAPLPDVIPRQPDEATEGAVGGGGGGGVGIGAGTGSGGGIGPGQGSGDEKAGTGRRRRRPELAGRVVGENRPMGFLSSERSGTGAGPAPYVSIHEATNLRTHDFFPRLPAALWPSHRPYVVVVDLCVSPEGRVSDAEFVVRGSASLDPIVLAAVRTWRYRPRLVGGSPRAFCHLITIQYEPA